MVIVSMTDQDVRNVYTAAYVEMESPMIGIDAQFNSTMPKAFGDKFDVEGFLLIERQKNWLDQYMDVDALVCRRECAPAHGNLQRATPITRTRGAGWRSAPMVGWPDLVGHVGPPPAGGMEGSET